MDQLEPNNIFEMNGHDSEHNHNLNISPNGDASRAPQLNAAVTGHGGASSGRQTIGEGSDSDGDSDSASDGDYDAMQQGIYLNGNNVSDDEDETVDNGQEGVEDPQRDPSQPATPGCHCSCHQSSWIGRASLFSFNPPPCSGMHTPSSSVLAVCDSSGTSMESSVMLPSLSPVPSERNYSVHLTFHDDAVFRPVTPLLRFSLVHNPLALSPEAIFPYPQTLDFQMDNEDEE